MEGDEQVTKYAFPLICEFAHTSPLTREELWRCDGVVFFLSILSENRMDSSSHTTTLVLNALTAWLSNDIERVEPGELNDNQGKDGVPAKSLV